MAPQAFTKEILWRLLYITDADLVLDEKCPADIVERMFDLLKNNYPYAFKIGPSIRIDNLPDCYNRKQEVIDWESRYFEHPVAKAYIVHR